MWTVTADVRTRSWVRYAVSWRVPGPSRDEAMAQARWAATQLCRMQHDTMRDETVVLDNITMRREVTA